MNTTKLYDVTFCISVEVAQHLGFTFELQIKREFVDSHFQFDTSIYVPEHNVIRQTDDDESDSVRGR